MSDDRDLELTEDEKRALRGELPDWSHASFQIVTATQDEIDRVWREYWRPLFCLLDHEDPDLNAEAEARCEAALRVMQRYMNVQAMKAELYDAYMLVDRARAVYRAATGGLCDDLTASPDGIVLLLNHRITKNAEVWRERAVSAEARVRELESLLRRRASVPERAAEDAQ